MNPAHTPTQTMRAAWQRARAAWALRSARERGAVALAAIAVAALLLWSVALAPALRTLRSAPAQMRAIDGDLVHMRALGQRAQALQAVPALDGAAAARQFRDDTERLLGGSARLVQTGTLVRVTLDHVAAADLADWLAQVRTHAHVLPAEAQLTRDGGAARARWSGTLSFNLPA